MKNKILFSLGGVVLLFVGAFFIFGQKKVEAEVSPHLSVLSGNLIIKVEVGTLRGNTVYGTLVSTRALSSTEAGGLKFRVYERGGLAPKIIKDNLSVGSISVPVNTNGYDLAITQNSSIPKEWKSLRTSCTWDGGSIFEVGTEGFSIKDGKTTTCVVQYYTDSQEFIRKINSAYGEPAVLPVANSALVKAEFKKVILDNSKEYGDKYRSTFGSVVDLQKYSYGGNKYLIVTQDKGGKAILSVWDLKDPLNPLFKKDNFFSREEIFGKTAVSLTKYIRLIDNYPYFIVGTSMGDTRDINMSVFKFDVSGTITKVTTLPRLKWTPDGGDKGEYDAPQIVVGMFKSGNKVYVARIGGFDQDENCQALVQNKNDSLLDPSYIYFFDMTNGMDGGLPASACVGGWKFPGSFNQESEAHATFISGPQDMFSVSSLGKDYVGFTESASIHYYHSGVDLMTLLDVTDINNIKPITKGMGGTQLFSDIFSYSKDLAPVEKFLIGLFSDTGPYGLGDTIMNSNEKTLVDKIKGTLVHLYEYEVPDYTGQGSLYAYTSVVGTVPEGFSKIRMRSYILEANLENLSINSGTKQVLCEDIDKRPRMGSACGSALDPANTGNDIYKTAAIHKTTGFLRESYYSAPSSILFADNGFVFSGTGMTGIMSSSGFGFSDTSAEFDKFFNLIENKNITNSGFTKAVISSIDSKNAVVYAASPFHIEVVKVSLAGSNALPPTVRPHSIITKEVTSSPFTLKNLLNIFKRINNKID